MARLADVAYAIKSANAGPTWITFDVLFADFSTYAAVVATGAVSAEALAMLFHVSADDVRVYAIDSIRTIKATIPRRTPSGGTDETDFDGTQQFAPLLDINVDVVDVAL